MMNWLGMRNACLSTVLACAVGKCRTTLKTAVWMGSLKTIHLKNQILNLYVAVFNNII